MGNSKDKLPLVSVIIPSYNHEDYIEETIRSVWDQSYTNIELIVIDDCSSDRSKKIINRMKEISPVKMIVEFNEENEGLCRTLNRAATLASGKYISVLASDDRFLPNKIKDITSVFESGDNSFGMVYANGYTIDKNNNRIGKISKNYCYKSGYIYDDLLLWRFMIQYSTVMYPLSVLKDVGYFNEAYSFEDWDLFLRISKKYPCFYLNKFVSEYRVGKEDSLSRDVEKLVPSIIDIFNENISSYDNKSLLWKQFARSKVYLRIGQSFYIVNDFNMARYWLIKSIFTYPLNLQSYNLFSRSLLGKNIINWIRGVKRNFFLLNR